MISQISSDNSLMPLPRNRLGSDGKMVERNTAFLFSDSSLLKRFAVWQSCVENRIVERLEYTFIYIIQTRAFSFVNHCPKESKFLGDRPTLCQKVVVEQLHEAHCAFYNKAVSGTKM